MDISNTQVEDTEVPKDPRKHSWYINGRAAIEEVRAKHDQDINQQMAYRKALAENEVLRKQLQLEKRLNKILLPNPGKKEKQE